MQILLFSALAGICGTGLGGLLSIFIGTRSKVMNCWMLSFAAGVMTSIVCFGLVPEALDLTDLKTTILGLLLGIIVIMPLNHVIDKLTESGEDLQIHHTPEELYHEGPLIAGSHHQEEEHREEDYHFDHHHHHHLEVSPGTDQRSMLRSGMVMLIAIGLHNIPEGLAIGAGGSHDLQLGILLALMIGLHNVPEGMAIAAPLLSGGVSKPRVVLLTALSGAPTLLGGMIGVLFGAISDPAIALSLTAAGGAMLYVVFGEIIPQAIVMLRNRSATVVTLVGIIVGLLLAQG